MIYHVLFALFAGKAAGFAAHPHDDHHDHDMQGSIPMPCTPGPPEPLPGTGLQEASDIYQGVTVARIKPMMVDRLTKCIYGSYFYEPPDHDPCGAVTDPANVPECSCFTINNLFRNHQNTAGLLGSTVSINDGHLVGIAWFANHAAWDLFTNQVDSTGATARDQVFRPILPFLDLSDVQRYAGPSMWGIWGPTAGQAPCGDARPGCANYIRVTMLPVASEGAAMRIRDISRRDLAPLSMTHPGFLWSTGMYDEDASHVFAIAAYASYEEREHANSRETAIGQAWWGGIAPMFPDFDCECPMGFSPNICGEGRFAGVTDWITSGDGTPGSGCNPPDSGCLGGESCMCTSNEDCSNCAPSEGVIQGPFPIGPNGAHMKINAGGCVTTISGQSEWSHSGRDPATGGADSRGVDPHQEAWLSSSFDTWFAQGAAGCDPCGVTTVCFENDADGNPAPIDPLPEGCVDSICSDINSICYVNASWPETFDAVPCRAGYGLSAGVQAALGGLELPAGVPPLVPIDCGHPMAAACIEGCTGGAIGCGGCGANNALNVALQIGPYTGMTPEEAQTASWATVCPEKCGNPNYVLADGELACDTNCIPFIGCFNCD
jgi:hypothetical protein